MTLVTVSGPSYLQKACNRSAFVFGGRLPGCARPCVQGARGSRPAAGHGRPRAGLVSVPRVALLLVGFSGEGSRHRASELTRGVVVFPIAAPPWNALRGERDWGVRALGCRWEP